MQRRSYALEIAGDVQWGSIQYNKGKMLEYYLGLLREQQTHSFNFLRKSHVERNKKGGGGEGGGEGNFFQFIPNEVTAMQRSVRWLAYPSA